MKYKMTKARTRQLDRVRHLVRSFRGREYQFNVDTNIKLSDLSKLSTVALSRITPGYLYKRSTKEINGKKIKGVEARKIENIKRSQKAARTRKNNKLRKSEDDIIEIPTGADESTVIVENFISIIEQYPTWAAMKIKEEVERILSIRGYKALANAIKRLPKPLLDRIVQFAFNSANESESMNRAISSMIHALDLLASSNAINEEDFKTTIYEFAPGFRKGKATKNTLSWIQDIIDNINFDAGGGLEFYE